MGRLCKNCEYYNEIDKDGYCYRYPPRLVTVNKGVESEYPIVDKDVDWCGEFREVEVIDSIEA